MVITGCAGMGDDSSPFDKVITKDTDLYQTGLIDSVSERRLDAGVRVRILGMSGDGRLQVELVSGEKGFVDSNAVGDPPSEGTPTNPKGY